MSLTLARSLAARRESLGSSLLLSRSAARYFYLLAGCKSSARGKTALAKNIHSESKRKREKARERGRKNRSFFCSYDTRDFVRTPSTPRARRSAPFHPFELHLVNQTVIRSTAIFATRRNGVKSPAARCRALRASGCRAWLIVCPWRPTEPSL